MHTILRLRFEIVFIGANGCLREVSNIKVSKRIAGIKKVRPFRRSHLEYILKAIIEKLD